MKILVTGGAGFIGSHIVDGYIDLGHDVAVIDNLSSGRKQNIHPDAKFFEVNIESSDIERVFEEIKPDLVNHQAAQVNVRKSVADPVLDAEVNILGSLNVFQNSIKYLAKKIIFASSGGAIYGEQDEFPADEDHALRPVSPYGVSKLSVEKYLFYYRVHYGLDYTILRYANVYGPRQDPFGEAGVVAIFTKKLLSGEKAVINGNGKQTRDFVYVKDIVDANVSAINKGGSGIYNIGTSHETDINNIFSMIAGKAGTDVNAVHGPDKPGEQKRSVISCKSAERALGWQPRLSLEEGLERTIQYFRTDRE